MEKDLYSHHYHLGCYIHEALKNPTHCALYICMEVKREMAKTSHVKEEGGRINWFVPAVCGVTTGS